MVEMQQLLRKHDAGQHEIPKAVVEAIDRGDDKEAERLLKWGGFWGGAGSVDDLILFEMPWRPTYRVDKPDNDRLRLLLHLLRGEMMALHILGPWNRPLEELSLIHI